MASLHDLIYSQTSTATSELPPPLHQPTQEEEEADSLNAFYNPNETITFEDPQQKEPTKRKSKRQRRRFIRLPFDEEETASQAAERKRKQKQQRDWDQIRHRWKRKKFNLQSEQDHGGAIEHVARLVYNHQKKQQTEQPVEQNEEDNVEPVVYVDSSDEERDRKLGSLLTPPAPEPKADDLDAASQEVDYKKMDYLSQGYVAPLRPAFTYGHKAPFVLKKKRALQESDNEEEELNISNMFVTTRKREPFQYFPIPHAFSCPTTGAFYHQRNLFRMAARCLIGQCNTDTQDRLLRALHYKFHRDAHRIKLLLGQAKERAVNLELYYQHEWKNSAQAIKGLGLGPEQEDTGPKRLMGFSLKTSAVYDDCRKARKRVVKELSTGVRKLEKDTTFSEQRVLEQSNLVEVSLKDQTDENIPVVKSEDEEVEGMSVTAVVLTGEDGLSKTPDNEFSEKMEQIPPMPILTEKGSSDGIENSTTPVVDAEDKADHSFEEDKLRTAEKENHSSDDTKPIAQGESDEHLKGTNSDVIMEDAADAPLDDDFGAAPWEEDWPEEIVSGALLQPTSSYAHEPGTVPPLPPLPLDQNGLLFGPADKFAQVMHSSDVDANTHALTMSVLLRRLGVARQNDNHEASVQAHEQILSYLEQTIKQHPDHTKFVFWHHHDLPIVPLYRAIMGYCSYLANAGSLLESDADPVSSQRIKQENIWSGSDSDSQNEDTGIQHHKKTVGTTAATINVVARRIHDHCERFLSDKRLVTFPRVHLTIGMARMLARLPPAAAEILARPCDAQKFETPFERMRATLEFLEEKDLLVESRFSYSEDGTVIAGELEHTLHLATEVFERCLEMDSKEVIHHEWYMAALAGSLLLCSGNAIGSGARCHPSSKQDSSGFDMFLSQDSERAAHEARKQLDNFNEVRKLLARAVVVLNDLACKQHGSRHHFALSSFFEWKQVIALLIGPQSRKVNDAVAASFQSARRLHAYHTVQWSIVENSVSCFRRLEELFVRNEVTVDAVAAVAAGMLENDPGNIENWRRLAFTLGPLFGEVSAKQRDLCETSKCVACMRLRPGFNIDHNGLKERKEELGWWGESREWWGNQLIVTPRWLKSKSQRGSDDVLRVSNFIERRLSGSAELISLEKAEKASTPHPARPTGVGISPSQDMDLSWLLDESESDHSDEDEDEDSVKPSMLETTYDKSETFDTNLPRTYAEVLSGTRTPVDRLDHRLLSLSKTNRGCALETLCYKILVTCHLNGVMHTIVADSIWFLARVCCDKADQSRQEDSDEWHCLVWLSAMGLSVPQVLHDLYNEALMKKTPTPSRNQLFSPGQKETIVEGVKTFGTDWKKIRSQHDTLKEFTNIQIKDCYRWMVKKGEATSPKK